MMRWSVPVALAVTLVFAGLSVAQPAAIGSDEDFEAFVQTYYRAPNPELVEQAIAFIGSSGLSCEPSAQMLLSSFFAEIFEQNPTRVEAWVGSVDPDDAATLAVLESARTLKPRETLVTDSPLPQLNDMYWSAYFASGYANYVERIIENLRFFADDDPRLFLTAASAKWSLASNARSHPAVLEIMEAYKSKAKGVVRKNLKQALTMSPEAIHEQNEAALRAAEKSQAPAAPSAEDSEQPGPEASGSEAGASPTVL